MAARTGPPIELQPLGDKTHAQSSGGAFPPPPPRRDVLPGKLGQGYRSAEDRAKAAVRPGEGALDGASYFGLVASGWFAFMALPLLLLPRLVLFFAQGPQTGAQSFSARNAGKPVPSYDRSHYDALTLLEQFLLRMLGLGALALAALCLFVVVPSYQPKTPSRAPTVAVLAILTSVTAVVCWNAPLGALAIITGLGNGAIAAWGWWTMFFADDDHQFKKYLKPDSRMKRL